MKRNKNIELFRVVAAFAILFMHTTYRYPELLVANQFLGRVGVPFFYLVTGYFLLNDKVTVSKIWRFEKKIVGLWVTWSLIYSIVEIPRFLSLVKRGTFNFKEVLAPIYSHWSIFGGSWYLTSEFFALLIIMLLIQFKQLKIIYIFIPVGYFILGIWYSFRSLFPENVSGWITSVFFEPGNTFLVPLFWFAIAVFSRKIIALLNSEGMSTKTSVSYSLVFLSLSGILWYIELSKFVFNQRIDWHNNFQFGFTLPLFVLAIFIALLVVSDKLVPNIFGRSGGLFSESLFFSQFLVLNLITPDNTGLLNPAGYVIFVTIVASAVALGFLRLTKNPV